MNINTPLIVFFIIVFFANAIEVVAGFGSVILAITFGAYFFSVQQLVPVLVPLNFLLGIILVSKYFKEINLKQLFGRILMGTGLGMPFGIYLFNFAPSEIIKPLLGSLVFILAAYELWIAFRVNKKATPLVPWKAWLFLFSGGVIQGLYASGGPLVVYYSVREFDHKSTLRSTLAGLWLILNLILIISLCGTGKINAESLKMSGVLLPAVLLGFVFGDKIHRRVSEKVFQIAVYSLLLIAGAGLFFTKN